MIRLNTCAAKKKQSLIKLFTEMIISKFRDAPAAMNEAICSVKSLPDAMGGISQDFSLNLNSSFFYAPRLSVNYNSSRTRFLSACNRDNIAKGVNWAATLNTDNGNVAACSFYSMEAPDFRQKYEASFNSCNSCMADNSVINAMMETNSLLEELPFSVEK